MLVDSFSAFDFSHVPTVYHSISRMVRQAESEAVRQKNSILIPCGATCCCTSNIVQLIFQ